MNVGHRTGLSWSFSFWGKGFGLERQDCGLYLFCAGSLTGLDSSAEHRSPGVERADPQGPSSLPIVRHRWSASTSFVLAALRALHVDPSYAVTKSAMIEEGTSSHWTWHFARTYRTPPSGRGNYGPGSLNRPTFMPGGPLLACRRTRPVAGTTHLTTHLVDVWVRPDSAPTGRGSGVPSSRSCRFANSPSCSERVTSGSSSARANWAFPRSAHSAPRPTSLSHRWSGHTDSRPVSYT